MSTEEELRRAERARQLLSDPLLEEILSKLEDQTVVAWKSSKDPEIRENAWMMIQAITFFRLQLQDVSDTGNIRLKSLEKKDKHG